MCSAPGEDDYLWVGADHLFRTHLAPRRARNEVAARRLHQLSDPRLGVLQWIRPLLTIHPGPGGGARRAPPDSLDFILHPANQSLAFGTGCYDAGEQPDVGVDVSERARIGREEAQPLGHQSLHHLGTIRDGADHKVGLESGHGRRVGVPAVVKTRHAPETGNLLCWQHVVAPSRDADQRPLGAERGEDRRHVRGEGYDAHGSRPNGAPSKDRGGGGKCATPVAISLGAPLLELQVNPPVLLPAILGVFAAGQAVPAVGNCRYAVQRNPKVR